MYSHESPTTHADFTLMKTIHDYTIHSADTPTTPTPLIMMCLRLACNLFAAPEMATILFSACPTKLTFTTTHDSFCALTLLLKAAVTQLTSPALLQEKGLRMAAAGLALNVSHQLVLHRCRMRGLLPRNRSSGASGEIAEEVGETDFSEEWTELLTATVHALQESKSLSGGGGAADTATTVATTDTESMNDLQEYRMWLVTSVLWCLYFSSGSTNLEILQVLEWNSVAEEIRTGASERLLAALDDVRKLTGVLS